LRDGCKKKKGGGIFDYLFLLGYHVGYPTIVEGEGGGTFILLEHML
jgi:hypothetical protein